MRKIKLFLSLLILALSIGNVWGAEVFKETFANSTGTSGFSGSAANGTFVADNNGWTHQNPYGAGGAAKFGTSKKIGEAETPSISCGNGVTSATLTFKAGAWSGDAKTLKLSYTNCSGAASVTLEDAAWSDYTVELTNITGDIKIKFTGNATSKARFFLDDVIVTVIESSGGDEPGGEEPVLSSIEIAGDLTNKTYEEGDELDLAGLTVAAKYDDNSEEDITKDVEWSYNPLVAGQTSVTITATYEGLEVSKTITGLTVNEHIITPNEYCIVPNNAFWGTSYNGSDANAATTLSGTQNDISILHTKSGSNLYVNNTQTRVYTNHAMQISVPSGYVITSIAFTADGNNWAGTHTANVGKMTDSKNWAGFANEVTITFGGTCRITNICVTYIKDVKYALTITEPTEGGTLVVKDGENTLASGAEIYEGTKLTVTATPETGYEEGDVVVKNASDEDVTATVYADGVLTMPAYAVTISATFEKKPCTLLTTPVVTATPTYNSATLTWEAVADAAKYSVTVGETTTEVTEPTYTATGLNAETTYTYQVQAIAEADQDTYCDSEVAEGSFTTTAAPVATLTLSDIDGTTTQTGALNGTITLPTTAAECSKTFVGWDADENCDHAPTYAPGAEYTFTTLDPTLYAVYADGEGGGTVTITPSKGTEETKACTFNLDQDGYTLSASGGGSNPVYNETNSDARIYAGGILTLTATKAMNTIVIKLSAQGKKRLAPITVSTGTIATQAVNDATVTWTGNATEVVFTVGDKANFGSDGETKAGQLCFSTIEVTHSSEYSNYSTTCTAALEKPTFSVAEGTYTEAKSIELNATEGDIYYTLDGSTPTASSEKYTTTPIVLDECGTTTINAIAISGESKSPIASATYTINLPITNTAATAYTPAEAIAIIDGACDKSEEVYVKGVVVSTSEFNETYGNYDVIVKAVDDNSATPTTFTFYRMYKAAGKIKFTASDEVIGVGDIITAKGKLTKYNTTYELAEGCYMVERVAFTEPKTDISNTEATAYTVDKAFELISDIKSDLDKEVYVKGFVAVASTQLYNEKYLTYSISDNGQTTGNVLKVYDGLDIGGEAFASKDDVKAGDYVVVKGKLLNYGGTYEINKDNQLVQHVKAATITIADITMEVGETKTIAATITPDAAQSTVQYAITSGNEYITLDGTTITAVAAGTATITATVAEGTTYMGNSVDFTVTVNPQNIAVLPFEFDKGKAAIETTAGMTQEGLDSDYSSSPKLKFDDKDDYLIVHFDSEPGALSYTIKANVNSGDFTGGFDVQVSENGDDYDVLVSYTELEKTAAQKTHKLDKNVRYVKFVYTNKVSGQNVALGNILISKLSVLRADLYDGKWGTFCPDQKVTYMQGASFYTLTYLEMKDGMPYKLFFDEITTDYLEAGKPYLFIAEGEEIKGVKSGEVVSIASNYNGFYGNVSGNIISLTTTQTEYVADGDVVNNYGVINSRFTLLGNGTNVAHERAHVQIKNGQLDCPNPPASLPALAPGARRVVAGATGINTATGVDQVQGDNVPTKMIINGQLFILRGEKMYDAQGKLVK